MSVPYWHTESDIFQINFWTVDLFFLQVSSFKFLFENRFWATGPYKRRNSNSTYITTTQISVMGNITTHGGLYNFFECQMNELCQITYGFLMVITEDLDTFKHWYITDIISWIQISFVGLKNGDIRIWCDIRPPVCYKSDINVHLSVSAVSPTVQFIHVVYDC